MNSRGYFGTAILATVFAHTTVLADDNRVSSVVAKEQHSAAMSNFSIPAGDLQSALLNFSQQVDLQLLYASDLTAGITTQGIQGEYHPQAALELLLAGTGLTYRFTNEHTVTLEKAGESTLPAVEVSANAVPASEQLPMPFNGGQVADGVRLGILGNTDILDAPFSITSYTSKTIEDQQARSVLDVLANQPSVRSASARSNINEDFILRGFPVESQDIALNGMYALMPYFRVPVEMAERVEVFEGPSALLSGMSPGGNIGGSINIVPKRAGDRPVNRFTAQYFSDSVLGGHLDIGRRFGENDEFGARVNGMYRTGDTTVDYQSEEDKLGSVALDYQGDRLRLSADLIYQKQNIDGVVRQFTIAPTVTNLPSPPEGTLSYPGSWTDLAMEDSSGVFRAEFDLSSAVTLYAGAGARASKMDAVAGNPEITGNFGSYTYAPAWQLFDVDSRSYEAGMNSRFATGFVTHQLNISATQVRQNQSLFFYTGFPFQDGTITTSNDTPAPDLAGITVDKNKYVDTKLTSYAIADTLGFMDEKVKLTVGIRQQQVQVQNFNFLTGAPSGDAYDESKPTPVVGLVLKPWSETVSLYASYVEGLS
ncbi:TonB-dependent receptor [Ketobacter sp. MCCC 1A13808]|uniref:TonB-dependent receptor n=1 Tax=Ketobacter sp. MCCC 1A13808 TaxID=2602738 RepID=UPI000F1A58A6|nr:TonB-dependent receptor [Ketobacter sp. MCCC 1A13808]MVF13371.1 TonB-dependent receptor [Ketobacter sp. MCCC 1A13808]RLP54350.1 MAG: TonB-dependent receptor [Ketobacter sp.]